MQNLKPCHSRKWVDVVMCNSTVVTPLHVETKTFDFSVLMRKKIELQKLPTETRSSMEEAFNGYSIIISQADRVSLI